MTIDETIAYKLKARGHFNDLCFRSLLAHWCEWPIEQLFVLTLMEGDAWVLEPDVVPRPNVFRVTCEKEAREAGIESHGYRALFHESATMLVRPWVGTSEASYRIAFAFLIAGAKFAIEFEAHDVSSRHLYRRERALTLAGWTVLRFAESEVNAEPVAVVEQVLGAGWDAVDRLKASERARRTP